jgi:hypothetical protein
LAAAHAKKSALVPVDALLAYQSRGVEFLGELENLTVESDRPAAFYYVSASTSIV